MRYLMWLKMLVGLLVLFPVLLCAAYKPTANLPLPGFEENFYAEAHIGYAIADWADYAASGLGPFAGGTLTKCGNRGFAYGGLLGFQYIKPLSFEFAFFDLPTAEGTNPAGATKLSSWDVYFAAKIFANVYRHLYLFAKVGVSYHQVNVMGAGSLVAGDHGRIWSPMFGAGVQYRLPKNFYLVSQWIRIPAYVFGTLPVRSMTSTDLFTWGIGYLFII